jgi:hypothetical protein
MLLPGIDTAERCRRGWRDEVAATIARGAISTDSLLKPVANCFDLFDTVWHPNGFVEMQK